MAAVRIRICHGNLMSLAALESGKVYRNASEKQNTSSFTMKMKATFSFKQMVIIYQTVRCHKS